MDLKHLVADFLRESADKIEQGTCGLEEDELLQLTSTLMHQKLNKSEAASLLNISTRQFDRKIESGELPKGTHTLGSKQLYWYKDEILLNDE